MLMDFYLPHVLSLQQARRITEEVSQAENTSEEQEEPQGALRTFRLGTSQKSFSSLTLLRFSWWQESQCNM